MPKSLTEKIKETRNAIDKSSAKEVTADMFISTVRKYTRAKKLTQRMVNELIDRIEVHQAEKVDGIWEQRLTIHYNCVGVIDIPETLPIPAPEVTMNTRKGVYVSYAAAPAAHRRNPSEPEHNKKASVFKHLTLRYCKNTRYGPSDRI